MFDPNFGRRFGGGLFYRMPESIFPEVFTAAKDVEYTELLKLSRSGPDLLCVHLDSSTIIRISTLSEKPHAGLDF